MRWFWIILLPSCAESTPSDRALDFVFSKQRPDGSWGSDYGLMRSGQVMTPFVMHMVSRYDLARYEGRVERALDFISKQDPTEYPNYAAALSVLVLSRYGRDSRRFVDRLLAYQICEGWAVHDPPYGGWDYGAIRPVKPQVQRPDISVTAFVLEALRAAGVDSKHAVWDRARRFLAWCQNSDGGFIFTPDPELGFQNKAGEGRSYAPPTCDGIRGLLACGVPRSDPRIVAALKWLAQDRSETLPGLYFYTAYARARIGIPSGGIVALQRPDGSWQNEDALMKEDDPLIATGLALGSIIR